MPGQGSTSKWPLVQFILLAVIWGASFLFIAVGLQGLSPAQVVLGRLCAGTVALAAISLATRQKLPREPAVWAHLGVVSVLLCVVPFLLFAWAEQDIASGLASIYNATTPLMTTLVALVALPQERPGKLRLFGLLAGFLGVLVVLGPWNGAGGGSLAAQGACLLATACYGLGFVYLRRFISPRGLSSLSVATVQVGLGAVIMLVLAPWIATGPIQLSPQIVASILVLGMVGTGLAYVWNTNLVAAWGAANASAVTYLTPIVGVSLGVLLLAEPVTWNQPVGALIVVAGIAISQGRLDALGRWRRKAADRRGAAAPAGRD
ncbi:DMT family transporter [Arthrobacter sp. GMC3]|uniref:DMT family transporter n=1 Tax=Arthrobacter sp. GMC3 TaxID=2058894 RepID=UPI000CE36FD8|nr:DMT family transporter [Arthrobacter sp. GMC3]